MAARQTQIWPENKLREHRKQAWKDGEDVPSSRENKETTAMTFDEFISNTTLHGVRYVFDRDLKVRKWVWKSKQAINDFCPCWKVNLPFETLKNNLHVAYNQLVKDFSGEFFLQDNLASDCVDSYVFLCCTNWNENRGLLWEKNYSRCKTKIQQESAVSQCHHLQPKHF